MFSTERCARAKDNSRPPDFQSNSHSTELPDSVNECVSETGRQTDRQTMYVCMCVSDRQTDRQTCR